MSFILKCAKDFFKKSNRKQTWLDVIPCASCATNQSKLIDNKRQKQINCYWIVRQIPTFANNISVIMDNYNKSILKLFLWSYKVS